MACDCLGYMFQSIGADLTSQTIHPFYGSYRGRSPFWRTLPTSQKETSVGTPGAWLSRS